jgi:hypothetical protein
MLVRPDLATDMFFCASLQGKVGKYSFFTPSAVSSTDRALFLKAIWVRIEVRKLTRCYTTKEGACRAVDGFIEFARLPFPSAILDVADGYEIYWISDMPLTVRQWLPYAEGFRSAVRKYGLHCDADEITNPACILRVPATLNYDYTPPRAVRLVWLEELNYSFMDRLSHITC